MSKREQQQEQFDRRADDSGEGVHPIRMDLPEVERDGSGIPTFVFKDSLPEGDRPTAGHKTLEIVLLWREAVMSVGHYSTPRVITVGDALKNDFRVACDALPIDRFPLVEALNGEFVVKWTDGMAMEVRNEAGEILDKESLVARQQIKAHKVTAHGAGPEYNEYQYKVGLHDRIAVQVNEVTFVIQFVSPARILQSSLLKTIDFYFTKVLSLSFLGHLFLLLALLFTPLDPDGLSEDLFTNPNRFAKIILTEPEEAPKPKKKFELSGSKGGGRHKDEEGKFGKIDKPKQDALASTKGAPTVDPNKREQDRKIALESGIFKALAGGKGGAVSNVFGPGGLGTGINNAMGGLRGTNMGDAGGAGGLGTRGSGPGGGGTSLGIGGLGDGTGRGTGGLGDVDLGGRGKAKYTVEVGRTITQGCLSAEVVQRVISRARNQGKFCYDKELQKNPNLQGKVTTRFTIGPSGSVVAASVAETSMNNPAVEDCLVRVMQRLKFPPCAGGGVAEVTYPWIFSLGGT